MGEIPRGDTGAPFRKMNLSGRKSTLIYDAAQPLEVPEGGVYWAGPHGVYVVPKGNICRVRVRGDEVDRKILPLAKCEEFANPDASPLDVSEVFEVTGYRFLAGLRLAFEPVVRHEVTRGRASHLQSRINRLYHRDRCAIKFEILASGGIEEEPKIGFVPNFKIPLPDFS